MSENWRPMTSLLVHGRPCDTKEGAREMQWICQERAKVVEGTYRDRWEAYIVLPLVVKLVGGISGDHCNALLPHLSSLVGFVYFVSCIFIGEKNGKLVSEENYTVLFY